MLAMLMAISPEGQNQAVEAAAVVASALLDKSRRYASEADDRESIALWMENQRRTVFTALELMPEGPEKTETLREIILDASHSMDRI